ncbi:MAG TPA: sulfate ABC transporter substrate-binding protein [Pseudonocardia sp.]
MTRPAPSRHPRPFAVLLAVAALCLTACGGGSTDVPGGIDNGGGSSELKLVAYAVPKVGFDAIIPAFRATGQGAGIGFSQSYGASGDQSRKVARHVPADVVNFSVEPDVTRLVKAGLVDGDWKSQHPNNSVPFGSVVSLVVRDGNPLNIHGWDDLLRPGVTVITPNPSSSGSAKWNLLAPFAARSNGGQDVAAGLDYVRALVRDHITVNPNSGRDATTTFQQGQGDVLISYENEAIFLQRQNATARPEQRVALITPAQTFKIENPVAVVNTSEAKAQANAFVDFLFSDQGQRAWASAGFRPVSPGIVAETASQFPGGIDRLYTIDELGAALGKGIGPGGGDLSGWASVDKSLFGTSGQITKIYDAKGAP